MIVSAFLPMVKAGFMVSLPLAVASFLIGMVIAIAVALVRIMPSGGIVRKILLKLVETYISIIRGDAAAGAACDCILRAAVRRYFH